MATKKDNLPLTLDQDNDSMGTITYANEVIAIIAGVAANEVDGVAAMCSSSSITDVFGRSKNVSKVTKGVKVELGTEEAAVDVYLIVEYGTPIQTCAAAVQENVRKSIESMTGLHVVRVDVHVQGVSFEKEQTQPGLEGFESLTGISAKAEEPKKEEVKPAEPVKVEFEGEPTPAEEHEPTEADLELEAAKAEAKAARETEETVSEE
ncbi:MAG: Asp23/Gls24 family envelope stress response protein [Clostridia bacterium]|nr:Asp23/Gls24 family envelope stress response protein [Clostridia bacterium]